MKTFLLSAVAALALCAAPLRADQDRPVVVELFTSEGCSSCPAADALLMELAPRDDIFALSLHVDYWDYIGWKDPFGDPAHSERQRGYAAVGGRRSVYTPEIIVQGQTDIIGAKPMKLMDAVEKHAQAPATVDLKIARDGAALQIDAKALGHDIGHDMGVMQIHMLRYSPQEQTHVTKGENAGHVMKHANVVHGWQVLGMWDGKAPLSLEAEAPGDHPVVVLVQRQEAGGGPGAIMAAARLR